MNVLKEIDQWVQKGYDIRYEITDQFENGYQEEVLSGNMPRFTYFFFIDHLREMIWNYSTNTLEEGFNLALEWLNVEK